MAYGNRPYNRPSAGSGGEGGTVKKKWSGYKKPKPVQRGVAYRPISNPTEEQVAIIDHMKSSDNSLMCEAFAGCAKTSTAVEAMMMLPESTSIQYLVFNNRNAREAESKCVERIAVNTCHSFGLRAYVAAVGKVEISKDEKDENISRALLGPEDEKLELRNNFKQAVNLCKSYLAETSEEIIGVMDRHEIDTGEMNSEEFAGNIIKAMELAVQQNKIVSMSDMLWLPIKMNKRIPQSDVLVLDEVQDFAPVRLEMAMRAVRPGGKIFACGDRKQMLYLFCGADSKAIDNVIARSNADTLKLRTTFRCGKAIVDYCRSWVPDYLAADSNPDGVVLEKGTEQMMLPFIDGGAGPGDFIISRTNAPLTEYALKFLKEGRKVAILGKDLGVGLMMMVRRSKADTVIQFLGWLDDWKNGECEKLIARNKPCDHIIDKYDCLVNFCDGTNDTKEVIRRIIAMFADENDEGNKDRILLSTTFKIKGFEADRVWMLQDTFPSNRVKTDEDKQVAENLLYVSASRARTHLFLTSKD